MDKLKENLFAVALGGVAVVLLALAFFLVYKPWARLGEQVDTVSSLNDRLKRYTREKVLPTQDVFDAYSARKAHAENDLQSAEAYYENKTKPFRLYFDDSPVEPSPGEFYTKIAEQIQARLEGYRKQFGIAAPEEGSSRDQRDEQLVKGLPLGPLEQLPIPIAVIMKRFWTADAILDAFGSLDIGGLKQIDFPETRRPAASASSSSKGEAETKAPPYAVEHMDVTIKARMKASEITKLLEKLFQHQRVPFVSISSLSYRKPAEAIVVPVEITQVEDPVAVPTPTSELIQDPPVEVELSLRVLDWRGSAASGLPQ